MSHYAKLGPINSDGLHPVTAVHVLDDDHDEGPGKSEADGIAFLMSVFTDTVADDWKKTSYNTRGGKHCDPDTFEPDGGPGLRKNYAGIGSVYDPVRDAFYNPKPYPSWTLIESSCRWQSPAGPRDPAAVKRFWSEEDGAWVDRDTYMAGVEAGTITEGQFVQ